MRSMVEGLAPKWRAGPKTLGDGRRSCKFSPDSREEQAMRQSWLYFIAAALFLIAMTLDAIGDGPNLKTGAGAIMVGVMTYLGLQLRKQGK